MKERLRILCVDDEGCVLRSLERLFLDDDYDIVTAHSAAEGLEIMDANPAHIVISDYRMPGMNGVAFLRRICASWPDSVRIILSGHAEAAAIIAGINDGEIYRFILKPWSNADLKVAIAGAAEKYRLRVKTAHEVDALRKKAGDLQVCRNILDSLPVAVVGIDAGGTVVTANGAWEALSGSSAAMVVGRPATEALPDGLVTLLAGGEQSKQPLKLAGNQYYVTIREMAGPDAAGIIVIVEAA